LLATNIFSGHQDELEGTLSIAPDIDRGSRAVGQTWHFPRAGSAIVQRARSVARTSHAWRKM
jgi:hypothetical protein